MDMKILKINDTPQKVRNYSYGVIKRRYIIKTIFKKGFKYVVVYISNLAITV